MRKRQRFGRVAFVCLLAPTLAVMPATAHAQKRTGTGAGTGATNASTSTSAEYDHLIEEALVEYNAGRFEEALTLFEQAYAKKPSARALRGSAKALFELRAYTRCIKVIDQALASDSDPLTGALREDLEKLRLRTLRFVGRVELSVSPSSATVLIDGAPAASFASGGQYVLDVGPHVIEASAEDHHPTRRSVEVHGDESVSVDIRLHSSRVALASAPPSRTGRIALSATALALSAGAVVASTIWFGDRNDAKEKCTNAALAGARCENANAVAFQRDASMWGIGISSAAVIASGVALVLALMPPRDRTPATPAKVGFTCGTGPHEVACGAVHTW